MSKPFTYWVRLALVATMCTLVTFSPVSAGRWMDRLLHRDACKTTVADCCEPIVSCESSCLIVPSAPCVVMGQPACAPATSLGCDSMPSEPPSSVGVSPKAETSNSAIQPMLPSEVNSTPAPVVQPTPVIEAPKVATPVPVVEPPAPIVSPPLTIVETPAPVVEKTPIVEPVPVVPEPKPVIETQPPVTDPIVPEVKTKEPEEAKQKDPPIEDLFGTELKPAKPVKPALLDDPFGTDPKPTPVETVPPKAATPTPIDDLFGSDPKPAAPATATPIDDLFGTDPKPAVPATATPIDDLFGSDPKPAAPATDTPIDDLFGSDPKPAAPATAESIDDLFGSDPKPAVPEDTNPAGSKPTDNIDELFKSNDKPAAEPSIDDLFGKPIAIEVGLSNVKSNTLPVGDEDNAFIDSLFRKSSDASKSTSSNQDAIEEPSTVPNQAKPQDEKSPVDGLDSLFGVGSLKPASAFKGAEYRFWVDNSGAYRVNARLAVIYVDKIKLLKENGKFTTVPLSRLSDVDFGYVSWVASNLTGEQTARMVKTESNGVETDVSR